MKKLFIFFTIITSSLSYGNSDKCYVHFKVTGQSPRENVKPAHHIYIEDLLTRKGYERATIGAHTGLFNRDIDYYYDQRIRRIEDVDFSIRVKIAGNKKCADRSSIFCEFKRAYALVDFDIHRRSIKRAEKLYNFKFPFKYGNKWKRAFPLFEKKDL